MPVQAPTRGQPFYGYSEKPPHVSRLLRHAWEYGRHILELTPGSPRGKFNIDVSSLMISSLRAIVICEKILQNYCDSV